ncbi:hypothetical protein [Streptomyces sp. NPDC001139]
MRGDGHLHLDRLRDRRRWLRLRGRTALVEYLRSDVARYVVGSFPSDQVRRGMYSAAAKASYLSGWMAFDNGEHDLAEPYFNVGLKLAARAGDAPLSGHILRAMAHQALDLGLRGKALELSSASVAGQRYVSATPRERALLGVVHARCLAATGQEQAAAKALLRAEDDLRSAHDGIEEPERTFFFGEASLAHETACVLRDLNDRKGAVGQFGRSVRTRGAAFKRTHAVTLGYLAPPRYLGATSKRRARLGPGRSTPWRTAYIPAAPGSAWWRCGNCCPPTGAAASRLPPSSKPGRPTTCAP